MKKCWVITEKGWAYALKLLAGGITFDLDHVEVGSGTLPEGEDPALRDDLIRREQLATTTVPVVDTVNKTITFEIEYRNDMNGNLEEGFYIGELGIFANDPDEGTILMYYGTLGDHPQWIDAYDGLIEIRRWPVTISLREAEGVVLQYYPMAYVTASDMRTYFDRAIRPELLEDIEDGIERHNTDPEAHANDKYHIDFETRIARLEAMLLNDIVDNPWSFFANSVDIPENLDVEGYWDQAKSRIVFEEV